MKNTLSGIIFFGIFFIPFIPFLVTPTLLFPFITGKAFVFRIIVEIIFIAWLILALRYVEFRPRFSWILFFLLLFVATVGLADLVGVNSYKSFWSNYERMEGYITILHLFAYFLVLGSFLKEEKTWKSFFAVNIGASFIMGCYGLFQLAGKIIINQGGVRVDGRFGNATYLAVYMLFNIFFAIFLFVKARSQKEALWWFVPVILLDCFILYATATRGAILGLFGGLLVTAIATLFYKSEKKYKKIAGGMLIAMAIVVLGFLAIRNTSFVKNSPVLSRFSSLSASEIKTQGRYYIWPIALKGIKERPILGWGQENFNYVFNKYYVPQLYAQEQWFDRAHSTPLDWFIASGILGGLLYLLMFGSVFYYLVKYPDHFIEKAVLLGLLSAYFFQNIFVFDNLVSYLLFFAVIAYIHNLDRGNKIILSKLVVPAKSVSLLSAVSLIIVIFIIYFANLRPLLASSNLINALNGIRNEAKPSEVLSKFKKSIGYNTLGNTEVREQLYSASSFFYGGSVQKDIKDDYYKFTRSELEKQVKETPKDARYYIFLGSFLAESGQFKDAFSAYAKAHELSPKKQAVYFETANIYFAQENFPEALKLLKEAFEMEPRYWSARALYATAAIYSGNNALANELLKDVSVSDLANSVSIINAYVDTGQFNKLLPIFIERVRQKPNDKQPNFSLAALYLELGDRQRAISVLREFAEKNPELKSEVDSLIQEIQAGRKP